jgi:hypothetical protein
MASRSPKVVPSKRSKISRNQACCTVCAHPERLEIEREFVSWKSPAVIAAEYKLCDRSSVYRHAHAFNLISKRDRNLRGALCRIIEGIDEVKPNAGAIVQAIALLGKINSRGELVEPREQVGLHELFSEMTREEIQAYAEHGTLPHWFAKITGAKGNQVPGEDENA